MRPVDALMNTVEWTEREGNPPNDDDGIPYATHEGVLKILDMELKCYRLSNGQAVFDADDLRRFFGLDQ